MLNREVDDFDWGLQREADAKLMAEESSEYC